ncbi:MAG TPA: Stf0 family sulfotransferase [Arenimonas sp.]|nr:Stf0 family sulfotransferase [Arenimonas sp.]
MTAKAPTTDEMLLGLFRDLRDRPDGPAPSRKIALISTPRSGSKLFCKALIGTGRFGEPKEWMNFRYLSAYATVMGSPNVDVGQYLDFVARKTTSSNGVFALNIHVEQFLQWRKKGLDILKLGFKRYYRIYRGDRLAQALSLAKARITDQWSASNQARRELPPGGVPTVTVLEALRDIGVQDAAYEELLASQVRMTFRYEDFSRDDEDFRRLLADCGIEHGDLAHIGSSKQIQRDAADVQRYQQLRQYLGVDSL